LGCSIDRVDDRRKRRDRRNDFDTATGILRPARPIGVSLQCDSVLQEVGSAPLQPLDKIAQIQRIDFRWLEMERSGKYCHTVP
jgi:hypothetical protein